MAAALGTILKYLNIENTFHARFHATSEGIIYRWSRFKVTISILTVNGACSCQCLIMQYFKYLASSYVFFHIGGGEEQ